jgi:hypothetical protein
MGERLNTCFLHVIRTPGTPRRENCLALHSREAIDCSIFVLVSSNRGIIYIYIYPARVVLPCIYVRMGCVRASISERRAFYFTRAPQHWEGVGGRPMLCDASRRLD